MIAVALIALVGVVLAVAVVTGGFEREPVRYFDAPGYEESATSTEAP